MKKMSLRASVEWIPREGNREADRLANGIFHDFDHCMRIPVSTRSLVWEILPEALEAGRSAEDFFQAAKASGQLPNRTTKQRKRKVSERLRTTDPW